MLLAKNMPRRQLFLHNWMFGNGYFGCGVYWIYNSLHDFGQAPPALAAIVTTLLVMLLAVFPALALYAWQWSKHKAGDKAIWLLPLFWFAFEWLRGWFLTGMPWLSLGYAHTESPLAGFGPLVGVYGMSALSILISVSIFWVLKKKQYIAIAIPILILGAGLGLQSINWTEASGQALKVTLVQGNTQQAIKWQQEQRQNIFDTYWQETIQHWNSDLIIWPETAIPGSSESIQASILTPLSKAATEQRSSILTGIIVSDRTKQHLYNSLLLLGEHQGVYHKRHLVPFGEYYPFRWLLNLVSDWINIPYSDLTPGPDVQQLMSVKGLNLGVSICFEDAFSRDVMPDVFMTHLLVNASNDAWFGDSLAPHQHLQMAQMRAIETGRPMVRATNTGISAFIDSQGRIEQISEQFQTQSLSQVVYGYQGVTPFYYFFKVQGILSVMLMLAALYQILWRYQSSSAAVKR